MKNNSESAKRVLERIAVVFFILWFIAAVTDLLGTYEYEIEFLQFAVVFLLFSRIPAAFRKSFSYRYKLKRVFLNLGLTLVGLWAAFKVLRWIGWFGTMEVGVNIDYMLITGIISLLAGGIFDVIHEQGISIVEIWRSTTPKTPKRLSQTLYCPRCKNKIEKNWISCPHCGHDLKDDTQAYDDNTRIY
jgi:ABC-type antimicrobial peptide transport system permease subunit